ncbi:hypothetical protein N9D23_10145 [Rubripirellula sp.]|nr:hypothetical protein [Planctomycetaceae bacterium]MDA9858473.1 hypothetical protein [Rubripirellula sp.]
MRLTGHVLMWGGFLVGAFYSLSYLEVADSKWSTVPWAKYFAGIGLGIVGVVLLRVTGQKLEGDEESHEAKFSVLCENLSEVISSVSEMASQKNHDPAKVLNQIDNECAEPLSEFANARQALVRRFGMSVYAEVMTEFASAERYINRCWSAAADGYVDEIRDCLQKADTHLAKTDALIAAAEKL